MWFKIWATCSNWLRQQKEAKAKRKQLNHFYAIAENIAEFQTKNCSNNCVLVFKLDDIGDYLLFENSFYKWLEKQENKQVFFVGNAIWKTLFEEKFGHFNLPCVWINKHLWLNEPKYQKEKAAALQAIAPEACYYPAFTRTLTLESSMGFLFPNAEHIGFDNTKNADQFVENFKITQYIKAPAAAHELELNAQFWEQELDYPFSKKTDSKSNYFIVGIGGNQKSKRWSIENYSTLIKGILLQEPHLNCYILGGKAEQAQANQMLQLVNHANCINYCEKLSLLELSNFCTGAEFAVCNDTAVAHVCALHQSPVLVIANGNRYGRFFPYPQQYNWVKAIYPKALKLKTYDWEGKFPINAVSIEEVLQELKILRNYFKN
jgi:hypothetical protein